MQHLEVSGAVRPLKLSLGVKWFRCSYIRFSCAAICGATHMVVGKEPFSLLLGNAEMYLFEMLDKILRLCGRQIFKLLHAPNTQKITIIENVCFFFCGAAAQLGPKPPLCEVSRLYTVRHPHPVRLHFTNDRLVAEAAT